MYAFKISLIFFFAILTINNVISAQPNSLIITDGIHPLPYATIINLRTGFGMFATEKGQVNINPPSFLSGDTLKISYTGYADMFITLPVDKNPIALQAISIPLNEVEVYPCLDSKILILKNYIKHKTNYSFSMGVSGGGTWAAYVPNSETVKGYIESITIEQSYFTVPANARKAPFKVRMLQYDSATGLPGKPLTAKEWMVYPTGNASVVQIGDENLRLPREGIVVCVDYFYAGEQYTFKQKVQKLNTDGTRTNVWQKQYGAGFRAIKGENLVGHGFMAGKSNSWMHLSGYGFEDRAVMVKINIRQCN